MKEIKSCKNCEYFVGKGDYKKSDGTLFHIYESVCRRYPKEEKKKLVDFCGEYKKAGELNEA